MTQLLMTMMGKENSTFVVTASQIVIRNGGRWLESQFSRLNGYFTGMALVEVPHESAPTVVSELRRVPDVKLQFILTEPVSRELPRIVEVHVLGPDSPTLVQDLFGGLSAMDLHANELRTHHMTLEGESYFGATMMVAIGSTFSGDVRQQVQRLGEELMLSVDIEDIEISYDAA